MIQHSIKYVKSIAIQYAISILLAFLVALIFAVIGGYWEYYWAFARDLYSDIATALFSFARRSSVSKYLHENIRFLDLFLRALLTPLIALLSLKFKLKIAVFVEVFLSLMSVGIYVFMSLQ